MLKRLLGRATKAAREPSQADIEREALERERKAFEQSMSAMVAAHNQQIVDAYHLLAHLNQRLRHYELAIMNVKQLGYDVAAAFAADRLTRPIVPPARTPLTSRMCTQADVESDWFLYWCQQIRLFPFYHRKLWELTYVAHALWVAGRLAPGMQGVGFGCGQEPLPSLFAKYGAKILATDQDPDRPEARAWRDSGQHADAVDSFRKKAICPDETLLANIDFRVVDMNAIPDDLAGKFDFCWSACALEHLGSVANGLNFIENSLRTLKPGGTAVHTTEFRLADGPDMIDNWATVLYGKQHLQELADRLVGKGYRVAPLDFDPGAGVLDGFIDIPPYVWRADPVKLIEHASHLKLSLEGVPCTSFGIIVTVP